MDNLSAQGNDESKAIVTAQQYSRKCRIKKSPALPPLSEQDMARAGEQAKTLVRSEDRLEDIVTFGSDAQAGVAKITKDMLARRPGRHAGRGDPALGRRPGPDSDSRYQGPFTSCPAGGVCHSRIKGRHRTAASRISSGDTSW